MVRKAGAGEVRIRIVASGINPGEIKKPENAHAHELVEDPVPRGRVVVVL